MTGTKIDSKYIFASLFLSRLYVSFAYGGSRWSTHTTGNVLASVFVFAAFALLGTLPTVFYIKQAGGIGILEKASVISPILSKILAVFYIASYFILCLASTIRYEIFAGTIILPNTAPFWFMIPVIAAACYGAAKGLKASSRTSFLISIIVGAAIVFISVTLIDKIDPDNITPLFYGGLKNPINISLYAVGATLELSVVALLLSNIKGKIIKNYYIWLLILTTAIGLLVLLTTGVLGDFGNSRMFPVYTVIIQSELGIFQRIDILLAGIWTLSLLIKLSFFILVIQHCLHTSFGIKKTLPVTAALGTILFFATILPANKLTVMLKIFSMPLFLGLFIVLTILIPILIPALEKIKSGRSRKFTQKERNSKASI